MYLYICMHVYIYTRGGRIGTYDTGKGRTKRIKVRLPPRSGNPNPSTLYAKGPVDLQFAVLSNPLRGLLWQRNRLRLRARIPRRRPCTPTRPPPTSLSRFISRTPTLRLSSSISRRPRSHRPLRSPRWRRRSPFRPPSSPGCIRFRSSSRFGSSYAYLCCFCN